MKPRISVLTLGVANLERSFVFYHGDLGLPTQGVVGREFEHGVGAFFELSGGLREEAHAPFVRRGQTPSSRVR